MHARGSCRRGLALAGGLLLLLLLPGAAPARASVLPLPPAGGVTQKALPGSAGAGGGLRWTAAGFAALGDSYSAGIGTHRDGAQESSCRLGLGAYPALLHRELGLDAEGGDGDGRRNVTTFQWLSCTGATTADVLGTAPPSSAAAAAAAAAPGQIDALATDPATAALDFVTLSVGGNDLGFFDVINACVFRFYGYYSGTCEAALAAAEARIVSPPPHDGDGDIDDPFAARLTVILLQLLERVRWEKRPRFRIVVTGYARFFNSDTDTCDHCSMSVWWHHGNATGIPPNATDTTYLTSGLRRRMNSLVTGTNRKLQGIVDRVNRRFAAAATPPRILFVDYDAAFAGHRFCEPGVVEPDYGRNDTWFFLVGGSDTAAAAAPWAALDASSPLVDPVQCRAPAEARGDWGERALCDLVQARAADPLLAPAADASSYGHGQLLASNARWYVPTYYGKTFHPRSEGHKAIRDAIYRVWEENGV